MSEEFKMFANDSLIGGWRVEGWTKATLDQQAAVEVTTPNGAVQTSQSIKWEKKENTPYRHFSEFVNAISIVVVIKNAQHQPKDSTGWVDYVKANTREQDIPNGKRLGFEDGVDEDFDDMYVTAVQAAS